MRTFLELLKLELKRMIKSIPHFLAGAIVLVLLAGTIAFSATKLLYEDKVVGKIAVGVVLPQDDKLASMALSMISSLDSVGSLCEFQYVDEKHGTELLKKGDIFALMKVPENLVQGIINGTNIPVTIIFPEHAGLEASVFKELTEAGASLLQTSQAGIYSVDEYLTLYKRESSIGQAEKDLNNLFLKYAISRENLFGVKKVSASGDVSITVFYGVAASVLVLLLLGIPAAPLMRPYGKTMEQKLYMMGIGRGKRTVVRTLSLSFLLLLTSALPFLWCMNRGYILFEAGSVLLWILVCTATSGWILFHFELAGSGAAGILALFVSTIVTLFLSGGFVPSVFLPDSVSTLGQWLPSSFLMEGVKAMIKGDVIVPAGKLILMELAVWAVSSAIRRDYE